MQRILNLLGQRQASWALSARRHFEPDHYSQQNAISLHMCENMQRISRIFTHRTSLYQIWVTAWWFNDDHAESFSGFVTNLAFNLCVQLRCAYLLLHFTRPTALCNKVRHLDHAYRNSFSILHRRYRHAHNFIWIIIKWEEGKFNGNIDRGCSFCDHRICYCHDYFLLQKANSFGHSTIQGSVKSPRRHSDTLSWTFAHFHCIRLDMLLLFVLRDHHLNRWRLASL